MFLRRFTRPYPPAFEPKKLSFHLRSGLKAAFFALFGSKICMSTVLALRACSPKAGIAVLPENACQIRRMNPIPGLKAMLARAPHGRELLLRINREILTPDPLDSRRIPKTHRTGNSQLYTEAFHDELAEGCRLRGERERQQMLN